MSEVVRFLADDSTGPWLALAGLGVFAFVAGTYYEWFEFMRNRGGRR